MIAPDAPVSTLTQDQIELELERQYEAQFENPAQKLAYERHCEEAEADYQEEMRTGRRVCPECEQRTVKVTAKHTRNYGGGWDTFEQCENPACDYADVFV